MTIGIVLLVIAAWVFLRGEITVSSRGRSHAYSGAEAQMWAAMIACFGVSMFGGLFRVPARMIAWMAGWQVAGLAAILLPAYL